MGGHLLSVAIYLIYVLLIVSVVSQTPVGCPSPPTSYSTSHDGEYTTFATGNIINYTCTYGFVPNGATSRTCLVNGTWTGSDDVCRIDTPSLTLACFAGAAAIFIFLLASCYLICRSRRQRLQDERRLTINRDGEDPAGQDDEEPHYAKAPRKTKVRVERSDSGLQTDLDMEDIDMNNFNMVDSPTENNMHEIETEWENTIAE